MRRLVCAFVFLQTPEVFCVKAHIEIHSGPYNGYQQLGNVSHSIFIERKSSFSLGGGKAATVEIFSVSFLSPLTKRTGLYIDQLLISSTPS